MYTLTLTLRYNDKTEKTNTLSKEYIDKQSMLDWLPDAFNGVGLADTAATLTACLAYKEYPNQEISYLNLCKEINTYIEVLRELDTQEDANSLRRDTTTAKVKGLTGFMQQLKMTMEDMG